MMFRILLVYNFAEIPMVFDGHVMILMQHGQVFSIVILLIYVRVNNTVKT